MRRVDPTPWRGMALATAFTAALAVCLVLTPGHAHAELGVEDESGEPLGEFELPDWVPSVGFGFGLQAREVDSEFTAFLKSDNAGAVNTAFNCRRSLFGINPDSGVCDFEEQEERTLDSGSLPGDLQLLGPAWRGDLPYGLSIRPMLRAGAAWTFSRRVIASQGFEQPDMESNTPNADLRVEIEAEPRWFWYTGLGAAIQLPFERPTFLKISGVYHEQRVNVFSRVDRGFEVNNVLESISRIEDEDEVTIRGIGPSIGFETEVARIGPVAFSFAGDVMVTFPVSGTDSSATISQSPLLTPAELGLAPLCAPGQQPDLTGGPNPPPPTGTGTFCWDEPDFESDLDNPFYFGGLQVRLSWVGW